MQLLQQARPPHLDKKVHDMLMAHVSGPVIWPVASIVAGIDLHTSSESQSSCGRAEHNEDMRATNLGTQTKQ